MKKFRILSLIFLSLFVLCVCACELSSQESESTGGATVPPLVSSSENADGSSEQEQPPESSFESTADSIPSVSSEKTDDQVTDGEIVEVEGFTLKLSGHMLTWSNIAAKVYVIEVDGREITSTTERIIQLELPTGVYRVEVLAYVSLSPIKYAVASLECVISCPPPILTAHQNTISWNEVEGAEGYKIYKNGEELCTVTCPSYEVTGDGSYSVSVVFQDQRLNSENSTPIVFGKTQTPTLSVKGDFLVWSEVEGAAGYKIFVFGKAHTFLQPCISYDFREFYDTNFKELYPDGVTVSVCAIFLNQGDGEMSNEVIYK